MLSGAYECMRKIAAKRQAARSPIMKHHIVTFSILLILSMSGCSKPSTPTSAKKPTNGSIESSDNTPVSNQPGMLPSALAIDADRKNTTKSTVSTDNNVGAGEPVADIANMDDDASVDSSFSPKTPVAPRRNSTAPTPDIAPMPCQGGRLLSSASSQCADNEIIARSTSGVVLCFKDPALACQCQCGKPDCLISESAPSNTACR